MLHDGDKSRWYAMRDTEFSKEVLTGQRRFGAGDMLECEVKMIQSFSEDGDLGMEYEVTNVLSHIALPPQIPMFGDETP